MANYKRRKLTKHMTRKNARDFVDFDYLDKLSDDELAWLGSFTEEFYQARFAEGNTATPEERRAGYQANNERARDIWTTCYRDPLEIDIDEQIRTRRFRRKKDSDE